MASGTHVITCLESVMKQSNKRRRLAAITYPNALLAMAALLFPTIGNGAALVATEAMLPEVRDNPPAPRPEPVAISQLPLPPTSPSDAVGACTRVVNPRGTGCLSASDLGIQEGPGYMWDNRHVLLTVFFSGAPAAPDPSSAYNGPQVIAIRTDGTVFPNGDPWKCLTCGVPEDNRRGTMVSDDPMAASGLPGTTVPRPARMPLDHPQAFPDGKRALAGSNVIDCSPYLLTSVQCTPERLRIYPVRWGRAADGSGKGTIYREQRLNPDGAHMEWNAFVPSAGGVEQLGFLGKLAFNPAPTSGDPLVPRYDLKDVYVLINNRDPAFQPFSVDSRNPGKLIHNEPRGAIGEMRGWTRNGRSVIGMGFAESGNADLFITDLNKGGSRRLTRDPSYTDPMMMSPDDKWFVAMDTRTTGRHLYYSAMQGIPPLIDMMTLGIAVCCYNNGNRRFFQPILIDAHGDRGSYREQQLNAGPGTPGSPSDPDWNGRADPAWSPDGTRVVYWQALVTAPACGGTGQVPCPASTEPGGRRTRLMMANLTSRKPQATSKVVTGPIKVGWAIPLRPGDPLPRRAPGLPAGKFVMDGKSGGRADVEIERNGSGISAIRVRYTDYTDDGQHIINGTESASRNGTGLAARVVWHSDLRASGLQNGTKKTGSAGLIMSFFGPLEGELVTTIDGKEYRRPAPGN